MAIFSKKVSIKSLVSLIFFPSRGLILDQSKRLYDSESEHRNCKMCRVTYKISGEGRSKHKGFCSKTDIPAGYYVSHHEVCSNVSCRKRLRKNGVISIPLGVEPPTHMSPGNESGYSSDLQDCADALETTK